MARFFSLDTASGRAMWGSGDDLPLALRGGESRLLGLCFEGAPLNPALAWPVGAFDVVLAAWADVEPRQGTPDMNVRFGSELSPETAAQLMPWFSPPPGVVLKVPIAVPLPVMPQSSATSA